METLTVNIQLKIPVERDSAGRRLGIMNLLNPHINGCYGTCRDEPPLELQADYDIYESFTSKEAIERFKENDRRAEAHRIQWAKDQEAECQKLFGMSFTEVGKLNYIEMRKLRETHGVVWHNGMWAKATTIATI